MTVRRIGNTSNIPKNNQVEGLKNKIIANNKQFLKLTNSLANDILRLNSFFKDFYFFKHFTKKLLKFSHLINFIQNGDFDQELTFICSNPIPNRIYGLDKIYKTMNQNIAEIDQIRKGLSSTLKQVIPVLTTINRYKTFISTKEGELNPEIIEIFNLTIEQIIKDLKGPNYKKVISEYEEDAFISRFHSFFTSFKFSQQRAIKERKVDRAYSTLQIPHNASATELNQAFQRLMLIYHPDRNPNDKEAEEKAKKITAAFAEIKKHRK